MRWVKTVVWGAMAACGAAAEDPCDRYVDYMCDCHADDTGFDCAELEATYARADPDVQNSCALELSSQKDEDQAAGLECES